MIDSIVVNLPLQNMGVVNSIPHDPQPDQCMFDEFSAAKQNLFAILSGSFVKFSSPPMWPWIAPWHENTGSIFAFYRNECKNIFRVRMNGNNFTLVAIFSTTQSSQTFWTWEKNARNLSTRLRVAHLPEGIQNTVLRGINWFFSFLKRVINYWTLN